MRTRGVVVLAVLALLASPAASKPTEKTRYKYYAISGDTPVEIYSSMIRRGPDVNGVNAYASTAATSSQKGRLVLQGKSCRVDGYQFNIDFVINLPKLKNEQALSGATAAKWGQFKSFLKLHEETHRSIWMGCARQLEARVQSLRSKDCKTLDRQASQMWTAMRTACDKKHAAFDAAEQRRLLRHPFVRLVLSGKAKSAKGLKVARKK
jgi:predicted secreted Zn-dependent protease